MPIYNKIPEDWNDLQNKVAKIFLDMGFETYTEKTVSLVRGSVEVDVYAQKKRAKTNTVYIAECKYWNSPVPKQIVHAFRTIVSDFNVQAGYIVSKSGFQKGAKEAAENSNTFLMTFEDFQEEFYEEWLSAVVDELNYIGQPLRKYADYMEDFYDEELKKLSPDKQEAFYRLCKEYMSSSMISSRNNYKHIITGNLEMDYIDSTVERYKKDIPADISINSLMEYFDYAKSFSEKALKQFDSLFDNPPRHWTSIDLENQRNGSRS